MKTRVCIIRHGETDWNKDRRIQGHIDIPLNETGRAQAMAMAFDVSMHQDPFSVIYCSDLARAQETANALALRSGREIRTRQDLRERNFGIFQGVLKDEAELKYPEAYAQYAARNPEFNFETGESLLEFRERVLSTFKWIARHHERETIAVVCHAGLLDILYRDATGRALTSERDFQIPNCALNWFHYDKNRWHLDAWDDHHYLSKVIMDSVE